MLQPILRRISLAALLSAMMAIATPAAARNLPPPMLHAASISPPAPAVATSQPLSHLELIGRLGGQIGTSVITGTLAYLVEGTDLTIVDVADPAKPRRLARRGWGHRPTLMAAQGQLLYAVRERDLEIIDISSVLTPTLRGVFTAPANLSDLEAHGSLVYLTGDRGLDIIDVSDPGTPVLRGSYSAPRPLFEVGVAGTVAYVSSGPQLLAIDVSHPASPNLLGNYRPPAAGSFGDGSGWISSVQIANGVAVIHVLYPVWRSVYPMAQLYTLDIQNPAAPTLLQVFHAVPFTRHIETITNNLVYLTGFSNGIYAIDISRPDGAALATSDTPIHFLRVVGTHGYGTGPHDFIVFDLKNPGQITVSGSLPATLPTSAYDIQMLNGLAYIPNGQDGIDIADVSNPTMPVIKGSYRSGRPLQSIKVVGNRGYSAGYQVLEILDLSNPLQPTLLGRYTSPPEEPFPLYGGSIDVQDGRAYIATFLSGLQIFDVADPTAPRFLGRYQENPAPAGVSVRDVQVRGPLAYVASGARGLDLIDITNPVTPTLLGSYATQAGVTRVRLSGNFVYLAGWGGLDIFSIAQPYQPVLLGGAGYGSATYTQDLEVAGDRAYAPTDTGVWTFDISNPAAPLLLDRYPPPDRSGGTQVEVVGDTIYLADIVVGLQVLAPRAPTTTTIPAAGGSLSVPGDGVSYLFPANTFTGTVVLEHTLYYPGVGNLYGHLRSVGAIAELAAFEQSDRHPVQQLQPYTVTIQYDDSSRGAAIESTLALYRWDGSRWLREPGSRVDPAANTVTASPAHFGRWTIMGETHEVWLPVALHNLSP